MIIAHDYRAGRTFKSLLRRAGRASQASQRRLGKYGQRDKWSSCLTAAGASVIVVSGDKVEVQRDFSTKECRDSNAEKHIENTLAVVRKWREEEHKR